MREILDILAAGQEVQLNEGYDCDITIVLTTREVVVGVIEDVTDQCVTMRRLVGSTKVAGVRQPDTATYADVPRHYAVSQIVSAYFTDGS